MATPSTNRIAARPTYLISPKDHDCKNVSATHEIYKKKQTCFRRCGKMASLKRH